MMEATSSSVDTSNVDDEQRQQLLQELIDVAEDKNDEFQEPNAKKRKLSSPQQKGSDDPNSKKDKLAERLGGILCCAVCLDLPKASVYQVCFQEYNFILLITFFLEITKIPSILLFKFFIFYPPFCLVRISFQFLLSFFSFKVF